MSLETEASSEVTSESVSSSDATSGSSETKGDYSVTDPGYDSGTPEPVENELEALKAENTTEKTPSE